MPLIRALQRCSYLDSGPAPQVLSVGPNLAIMLICLQNGQEMEAPPGDQSETVFSVLSGAGFVREGDERHPVVVGDIVHIPSGGRKALVAGDGQLSVLGIRHLKGQSRGTNVQSARGTDVQKGRQAVQKFDVREVVPRERHARIFKVFDDLGSGEAFELINDHDPKPLYYQFQAERPGQVTWEYLEQGPDTWRVKVSRV